MTVELEIGLTCCIVAVTDEEPRVLLAETSGELALPSGPLDPERDRTFELALRRWVREQTGLELGYVEQLYTFGNRHRDPRERSGGPRVVAIAYLGARSRGAAGELERRAVGRRLRSAALGGLARRPARGPRCRDPRRARALAGRGARR